MSGKRVAVPWMNLRAGGGVGAWAWARRRVCVRGAGAGGAQCRRPSRALGVPLNPPPLSHTHAYIHRSTHFENLWTSVTSPLSTSSVTHSGACSPSDSASLISSTAWGNRVISVRWMGSPGSRYHLGGRWVGGCGWWAGGGGERGRQARAAAHPPPHTHNARAHLPDMVHEGLAAPPPLPPPPPTLARAPARHGARGAFLWVLLDHAEVGIQRDAHGGVKGDLQVEGVGGVGVKGSSFARWEGCTRGEAERARAPRRPSARTWARIAGLAPAPALQRPSIPKAPRIPQTNPARAPGRPSACTGCGSWA